MVHVYSLGVSSLSLPKHPMDGASNSSMSMSGDHLMGNDNPKRPRPHVPSSPSPASVVMNEGMMAIDDTHNALQQQHPNEFATPAAKRRRQSIPEWSANNNNNFLQQPMGSITPEEHRPPVTSAVATVSMERDDQYDERPVWWKKPPAAPQLQESTTMHPNNQTTDTVVGCNSCQRLFAPKITTQETTAVQQPTLLNYFSSNKPRACANVPPPSSTTKVVDLSNCRCTFCERSTCNSCLRACEKCQQNFCILCSTRAYLPNNPRQEQTLCLDCASTLDIPQSPHADAAAAGDCAMMEG